MISNIGTNIGNKNKKLNYVKRISQINNKTISLTIDNLVNNTYDNASNKNKDSKISYIKIKDNNNNQLYGNKKLKEKLSSLFPQKNESINHRSYQNMIIKYQKIFKSKEKKKKNENIKFQIMKDKIKKIHEIGKKKQLLLPLNKFLILAPISPIIFEPSDIISLTDSSTIFPLLIILLFILLFSFSSLLE